MRLLPSPGELRSQSRWLALPALIVAADQASKAWIVARLALGQSEPVTPWFNLVLAHNTGAAFSFLNDASGWQGALFLAIGLAASLVLGVLVLRNRGAQRLALALVMGGALGNVVDRVHQGYVVDFLDFHQDWLARLGPLSRFFYEGHFPAFNLADSAITAGAVLLVVVEFLRPKG